MAGTADSRTSHRQTGADDTPAQRQVLVAYAARPCGLSLTLAELGTGAGTEAGDPGLAMLRIGEGCVTLEIPSGDGRPSLLAWDPAEVDWAALVA